MGEYTVAPPFQKCRYLYIRNVTDLAALYMPFIRQGGLFIPTTDSLTLGEQLFLLVRLLDEPRPLPVCATVVWLTPLKAQGRKMAGVGVRFHDRENRLRSRIENYLAESSSESLGSLTL